MYRLCTKCKLVCNIVDNTEDIDKMRLRFFRDADALACVVKVSSIDRDHYCNTAKDP